MVLNSKENPDGVGGGARGTFTKHQEINCIHDVELDTTLHSTTLDRTTDTSSGRDVMLRGTWTRIWGERVGEAVITAGVATQEQLGSACWLACRRPLEFCNWVSRTDVSLRDWS